LEKLHHKKNKRSNFIFLKKQEIEKQNEDAKKTLLCQNPKVNFPGRSSKLDKEKWLDNLSDNKRTLKELSSQLIPHG
jgi:hypothetical protein